MSSLTTHVLDTANGTPARGMTVELWSVDRSERLTTVQTNTDGRIDSPLLAGNEMAVGTYELVFFVGDYFKQKQFLDRVPVRFTISDVGAKYHIPLLASPWSYTTYRGS